MKLAKIKEDKDNFFPKYIAKLISSIKELSYLNKQEKFYYLGIFLGREYFLNKDTIYVLDYQKNVKSLYSVKLLKEYPKNVDDIELKTIVRNKEYNYSKEEFLTWIDEPSEITATVDLPYYRIIKFLKNYSSKKYGCKNFLFYFKKDKDYSYTLNFYAKNLKTKSVFKLYILPIWIKNDKDEWENSLPLTVSDIVIEDISKNTSAYQKRQCKYAFLEFAHKICPEMEIQNFYVFEILKQTINPVKELHEWCCHRIFCKPDKFSNIWVYDFPESFDEPYFFLTDSPSIQETTKIAVLDFKTPTYRKKDYDKGIYKRGNVKRKFWKLDENYIKELIDFLKSPSSRVDKYPGYDKYVKTNWKHLIFEYNHNSAGWDEDNPNGWDPEIKPLPFDLEMPDYTQIGEDK